MKANGTILIIIKAFIDKRLNICLNVIMSFKHMFNHSYYIKIEVDLERLTFQYMLTGIGGTDDISDSSYFDFSNILLILFCENYNSKEAVHKD